MVDSIAKHSTQMNQKLTELYLHMDDHFDLNRDQIVRELDRHTVSGLPSSMSHQLLIRIVSQDLIYQPTRIAYKMLHVFVEVRTVIMS